MGEPQAASRKPQATSGKRQAASKASETSTSNKKTRQMPGFLFASSF
tara:strand:+ start:5246 stop:5386 length:141 start_codon:yes stop_codon:yes gene_type:complete